MSLIHEFKGKQTAYLKQKPQELERLVEIAKVQSTEASNSIEGIRTTETRLRQLMNEKTTPRNRDERDDYNACALCEYQREVKLIKRLINISEKALEKQPVDNTWSYEGICHSFAKTIVDYSKMAYDNVLLGHFHAVKMINRSILENLVCLDLIVNNEELWKYYWAYSYRSAIYKSKRTPIQRELDMLNGLYKDLDIQEDFYTKQPGRKKAFIQEPYGWTYKINDNKQFIFENICKLIGEEGSVEYRGFQMLSDYSHGTSFYMKMHSSVFVGDMMTMFVDMYINLYRMVTIYCWQSVDEDFDQVTDELECIFHRFIEHEEEIYNND